MKPWYLKVVLAAFLSVCLPAVSHAQVTPATQGASQDLSRFEGQYEYRDGLTLFMIAHGNQLVAVIDQSKYLLRPAGTDTFLNPAGQSIPFIRDAEGKVVAFKENGDQFSRLSTQVPVAPRLLLTPRPDGPDGVPVRYKYHMPPAMKDGIKVRAAGPTTVSPKVAEQLVNGVIDGTYPDVHSLLIYQHGALLLEEYFYGFDRDQPHEMRSFSKSVISLLAGAAIDRGALRADEPALGRLGYPPPQNPDPRKAGITLTQLLSNQSGLACNEHDNASPGKETNLYETDDWVKAFFDVPMVADPGTTGSYCSGNFYATGKMVERATGRPLPDFAQDALFGPLGLKRTDWKWNFTLNRSQRNAFGQVYLKPRDMLKLGVLIQNRGSWQGRQVLSAAWIDEMVAHKSHVDDSDYGLGVWHRWYGVQTPAGQHRVDTIMLSGNGGQKVFIVPSQDLIVVSTGNAFFVEAPVNDMLAGVILPALLSSTKP